MMDVVFASMLLAVFCASLIIPELLCERFPEFARFVYDFGHVLGFGEEEN